jgi:hypothetical protein
MYMVHFNNPRNRGLWYIPVKNLQSRYINYCMIIW